MPIASYFAISGVAGLVVAIGERGRITMFRLGDVHYAEEVPAFTPHDLHAVWVESPYSAWAVGEASTILHWNGSRWWPQATATNVGPLNAIWVHPDDGLWIGGAGRIINRHPTYGSSLYDSDAEIRCIWGRHGDDIWYLAAGRLAIHWNGERAERIDLPGDDDEQWSAVAGAPRGDTFIVGPSGFMLKYDGRRWEELPTDTTAILTGAVCAGSSLFVTTDDGMVREYRRGAWRTVAFSAFGGLRGICAVDDGAGRSIIWACGDRGVVLAHLPDGEE